MPALSTKMAAILGSTKDWSIAVDALDPQTLLFHYPQAGTSELSYIKPSVKIELGARSAHWLRETRAIRSYLGESLELPTGDATVQALAAERAFWEKATLLHAQCHRPPDMAMPARHYHDMARLANPPVAERALSRTTIASSLRQSDCGRGTLYWYEWAVGLHRVIVGRGTPGLR